MTTKHHSRDPPKGYIQMKQWRLEMAEKLHLSESAISGKLARKQIPMPERIVLNKRIIFVRRYEGQT